MKNNVMLIALLIAGLSSCTTRKEEKESSTRFLVTTPVVMDTSITQAYVCQIHSIQHIEIRAQERGYLQEIYVDEGQFVHEGQLLFKIMPRLYEADLQRAQAELEFAQIEYQNTKRLTDSNIVSPNELAMAHAKMKKAQAELSLAEVHLNFTEIRAPFDGIIDRFHVRLGSLIEEGDLMTSLSDNSKLWVYFNVPEAQYLDYRTNVQKDSLMKVELLMANNAMFNYSGIVETIEADFNNETGNISFRATFPNPKGLLRHGETGSILMRSSLKNVMLIPQKATFEVLDKRYVYVIGEDNTVEAKPITIGEEMPHLYVVTGGLKPGDKILLEGLRKVRNGEKINYESQDPNQVIQSLELYAE